MKFEHTEVFNFEGAIRGMRNPMNSWDKSDSEYFWEYDTFKIGEADLKLAQKLIKAGSEHRKFMRQIFVSVDITAPLYFWKEFSTYKIGTTSNSCSTMHKLADTPITIDCFEMGDFMGSCEHISLPHSFFEDYWAEHIGQLERLRKIYLETKDKRYWKELIRLLPESWLQKRTVTMSYENILSMYNQRCVHLHKLTEWSVDFMEWVKSLPYAKELLFIED